MNPIIQIDQKKKPTDVRKREIIAVAMNLLAFRGARAFTAKNVAAAIGMTSGGIFRHYARMEVIVEDIIKQIEEVLAADFPSGINDPIKRLEVFFLQRTQTILAHPEISLLLLSDHLEQAAGAETATRLVKVKKRSQTFVYACLRDARQAEILDSGVDIAAATTIVMGAILATSHVNTRVAATSKEQQITRDVWGLLEGMLKIA